MPSPGSALKTWAPAGALMALTALSALAVEGAPGDPRLIAAVFPPWWNATRVVRAAAGSGELLGFGALPNIVILHSETSGLARRASAAGALLTIGRDSRGLCIG